MSHHVTIAVVTDNQANLTFFDQCVDGAIKTLNNDTPDGMPIKLGPRMLIEWPNPMDVYQETCDKLAGTDVAAIVVTAQERTTISLSVAGGFLGVPVVGLGTRSFSFSNKVRLHIVK